MRSPRVVVIGVAAAAVAAGAAWYHLQRRPPVEPAAEPAQAAAALDPMRALGTLPPAPAAGAPPRAAAPGGPSASTEAALMEKIRRTVKGEPGKALDLIATANASFPDGPFTEERASLRIDALVFTGEVGRARDHAEEYLRRYPDGAFAAHVEQLTGVHPRPPAP